MAKVARKALIPLTTFGKLKAGDIFVQKPAIQGFYFLKVNLDEELVADRVVWNHDYNDSGICVNLVTGELHAFDSKRKVFKVTDYKIQVSTPEPVKT
jgi:hypothetical protein